jgi:hypothetical protein
VRRDVGVRSLTKVLRGLLAERWGVPSLPALLQRLVHACSRDGDADVMAAARSTAAPLGTSSGRRAIGLPTPVIRLGPADGVPPRSADVIEDADDVLDRLRPIIETQLALAQTGATPLIVVEPPLGNKVRRRIADAHPRLTVVARAGLPPHEPVEPVDWVTV